MKIFKNCDGNLCLLMDYGRAYVNVEDIAFIEGQGNYSSIFLICGSSQVSSFTLRKFEDFLSENDNFFVGRKGLLLNLKRVKELEYTDGKLFAIMKSARRLPLSRRKGRELLDYIYERGFKISIK